MKQIFLNYWKSACAFIVIFIVISLPGDSISTPKLIDFKHFDKIIHFLMFLCLAIFLKDTLVRIDIKNIYILFLIPLVISIFYGGLTEWLQGKYFNERSADFYDFICDSTGALTGLFLYNFLAGFKLLMLKRF